MNYTHRLQALNTNEINNIVPAILELARRKAACALRIEFLGVFPRDLVPWEKILTFANNCAICCIVNTDASSEPGQHWIAFYYLPNKDSSCCAIEYFDSYAENISHYNFSTDVICKINFHNVTPYPIQDINSILCGHYCIWFLYTRTCYSYYSLSRYSIYVTSQFKPNAPTLVNDKYLRKFIRYLLNSIRSTNLHSAYFSIPYTPSLPIQSAISKFVF